MAYDLGEDTRRSTDGYDVIPVCSGYPTGSNSTAKCYQLSRHSAYSMVYGLGGGTRAHGVGCWSRLRVFLVAMTFEDHRGLGSRACRVEGQWSWSANASVLSTFHTPTQPENIRWFRLDRHQTIRFKRGITRSYTLDSAPFPLLGSISLVYVS